jgi:hypothetical protein
MADKIELVIQALQERMGQIVSEYETRVAVLRAELTLVSDELNKLKENSSKE